MFLLIVLLTDLKHNHIKQYAFNCDAGSITHRHAIYLTITMQRRKTGTKLDWNKE